MLKRVQHENMDLVLVLVIPNQVLNLIQDLSNSGSRALKIWVSLPRPVGGIICFYTFYF
jgi:hypothetical protein